MTDYHLRGIYDRTQGRCHICGKRLSFCNYGKHGARGAWNIEHSIPRACGGTDHGNNLYPACIGCNSSKQAKSTRVARGKHGRCRAPMSLKAEGRARRSNALAGGGLGALIGGLVAGPVGLAGGAALGALFGHSADPES